MNANEITELELSNLSLLSNEDFQNEELKTQRFRKLQTAMFLWNDFQEKSKLIVKDKDGLKSLNTSVWYVTDKYVCLHAGITILVSCILDVI